MKLEDAKKHFGSKMALCEALGITKQAGSKWGFWMHRETAIKIEALTKGKLSFDYSTPDIEIEGKTYSAATDIDRAYRVSKNIDNLFFLEDKKMINAKDIEYSEALKMFRKYPPYRKV